MSTQLGQLEASWAKIHIIMKLISTVSLTSCVYVFTAPELITVTRYVSNAFTRQEH
jgi:hypothetical protein